MGIFVKLSFKHHSEALSSPPNMATAVAKCQTHNSRVQKDSPQLSRWHNCYLHLLLLSILDEVTFCCSAAHRLRTRSFETFWTSARGLWRYWEKKTTSHQKQQQNGNSPLSQVPTSDQNCDVNCGGRDSPIRLEDRVNVVSSVCNLFFFNNMECSHKAYFFFF